MATKADHPLPERHLSPEICRSITAVTACAARLEKLSRDGTATVQQTVDGVSGFTSMLGRPGKSAH